MRRSSRPSPLTSPTQATEQPKLSPMYVPVGSIRMRDVMDESAPTPGAANRAMTTRIAIESLGGHHRSSRRTRRPRCMGHLKLDRVDEIYRLVKYDRSAQRSI